MDRVKKNTKRLKANREDMFNLVHIACIDSVLHHNRSWNKHRIYKPWISTPL